MLLDPAGTPALIEAIRHMHGAEATFVESVPVLEMFKGEVVWQGVVQVFAITGHPTSQVAYAWSHAIDNSERRRFVVVLRSPHVDSPVAAVRAAIVAEARSSVRAPAARRSPTRRRRTS